MQTNIKGEILNIQKIISRNVRDHIAASGFTQAEVARRLGVDRSNFYNQLNAGTFKVCRLVQVAKILDVRLGDLLVGVE